MTVVSVFGQKKAVEKKYFPDPQTDQEFTTPAFEKSGFTKYKQLVEFLEKYQSDHSDYVKLDYIGETQGGKQIPILYITKPGSGNKIKLWYQAGVHGNEPASTEGVLHFMNQLFKNNNEKYLDNVELAILPMINIDGFNKVRRRLKDDHDFNRDFTKIETHENQLVRKEYNKFLPNVCIDFHEYNPYRADFRDIGDQGVTNYYDVMFLYSSNMNVSPVVKDLTMEKYVKVAQAKLDSEELRYIDYTSVGHWHGQQYLKAGSNSARSSSTGYALTNTVSLLMEIRGVGIGKSNFKRRVYSTSELALTYLKTSSENKDYVLDELEKSLDYIKTTSDSIVVKSRAVPEVKDFTFIDLASDSAKGFGVIYRNYNTNVATLKRSRPEGYIILSHEEEVIKTLQKLGFEMDSLSTDVTGTVEKYTIESVKNDMREFEMRFPLVVKTSTSSESVTIPAGSYYVSMRQKNAQLLPEVMEPESNNSFVSLKITKLKGGYHVYRVLDDNFLEK